MTIKAEVLVTIKVGQKSKSYLMKPNRDSEKESDKFHRVGSSNEDILTSGQGLYVSRKLIKSIATGK